MTITAADHFDNNIAYARNLGDLSRALDASTTGAVDVTDILRAAIVMAVSALDHYVHEKAKALMLEIHVGTRPVTDAFLRFPVQIDHTRRALANTADNAWLADAVRQQHGFEAFQKPDKIADALRPACLTPLWPAVAAQLSTTTAGAKTRLSAIVDRRNCIVHEADLDPTLTGARWPIDYRLTEDTLNFIESVVRAIEAVV